MVLNDSPIYNLGAVLHETGLTGDTLRAWERRYGIPSPQRTPGGHRLYSQRDILLVKWLLMRRAEGLSISHAVDRWRAMSAAGQDPLQGMAASAAAEQELELSVYGSLDALRDQWLAACLAYDEAEAGQVLNQAFSQYSLESVLSAVIQRGLREVGELWAQSRATVQQEHFLSGLVERRLNALIAGTPPPMREGVIVLACAQSEMHSLPLLQLNLLLRRRGRRVIFLGANVPSEQLQETATSLRAAVVLLCAERLASAVRLRNAAATLQRQGIQAAFGGRVFERIPNLVDVIPAHYAGKDMGAAVDRIEQLAGRPAKSPVVRAPVAAAILHAFREGRPRIEAVVQQRLRGSSDVPDSVELAHAHFGEAIEAALDLGDIAYLEADLAWIGPLLAAHQLPASALPTYLETYARAMREVLGTPATQTADWLEAHASRPG